MPDVDWFEIGPAWKKDGKKGLSFPCKKAALVEAMKRIVWEADKNGEDMVWLNVFPNKNKKSPNQPDYRLVVPLPAEEESRPTMQPPDSAPEPDDDLPF